MKETIKRSDLDELVSALPALCAFAGVDLATLEAPLAVLGKTRELVIIADGETVAHITIED